jgi:hemoglobin-like flavoprotein
MGLLRAVALLPLAPLEGVVWVADRLAAEADRQLHDEGAIRAQLGEVAAAHDRGDISDDEYDVIEEQLLRQMQHSVRRLDKERGQ